MKISELEKLTKLVRYWILKMTTEAGSGHVTSSLSAVELMVGLMFGGPFRFKVQDPKFYYNDRLIFSKGHASPLFYSLWAVTKSSLVKPEELLSFRKFDSRLEGHPTTRFPYTEAATGSLGQGLSVGLGMALNAKNVGSDYRTYVLLGDSEMAEGSNWEAIQLARYYRLDNLIGIIDVNRLGQRGETMYGWDLDTYQKKLTAFGWETIMIDGHDLVQIAQAYDQASRVKDRLMMIIARTVKGKGVTFLENDEDWHGKTLTEEQLVRALEELGEVDLTLRGSIDKPKSLIDERSNEAVTSKQSTGNVTPPVPHFDSTALRSVKNYKAGELVATREAYGEALVDLGSIKPEVVVLDGEVSNSTFAEKFKNAFPERFFEMFIAEQNMIGTAVGLAQRGKIPFVSTFVAFLTRTFDQIRMAAYSQANVKVIGSHAGVAIGEDGASQMGLEDIGMMRSIFGSVVLYPSDAVSTVKLSKIMAEHQGIVYMRTTRGKTPVIYSEESNFEIGGSKVLRQSEEDQATVVAAGITVHEALKAYELLLREGIKVRVIDLYSVKPLDVEILRIAADETKAIIVVEDHYPEGGIGEATQGALGRGEAIQELFSRDNSIQGLFSRGESVTRPVVIQTLAYPIISLAVSKLPRSGTPEELLRYEEIDAEAIVEAVYELVR